MKIPALLFLLMTGFLFTPVMALADELGTGKPGDESSNQANMTAPPPEESETSESDWCELWSEVLGWFE